MGVFLTYQLTKMYTVYGGGVFNSASSKSEYAYLFNNHAPEKNADWKNYAQNWLKAWKTKGVDFKQLLTTSGVQILPNGDKKSLEDYCIELYPNATPAQTQKFVSWKRQMEENRLFTPNAILQTIKKHINSQPSQNVHNVIQNGTNAIQSIRDIQRYIKEPKKTLVMLDLDQTLIDRDWSIQAEGVSNRIKVEDEGDKFINDLKSQGVHVMALTAQGINDETPVDLDRLGFKFSIFDDEKENEDGKSGFRKGVYYSTNQVKKGQRMQEIIEKYENTYGYKPQRVIFVDDTDLFLQSVTEALTELKIDSIAFEYRGAAAIMERNRVFVEQNF